MSHQDDIINRYKIISQTISPHTQNCTFSFRDSANDEIFDVPAHLAATDEDFLAQMSESDAELVRSIEEPQRKL